jgi:hypothetical protein
MAARPRRGSRRRSGLMVPVAGGCPPGESPSVQNDSRAGQSPSELSCCFENLVHGCGAGQSRGAGLKDGTGGMLRSGDDRDRHAFVPAEFRTFVGRKHSAVQGADLDRTGRMGANRSDPARQFRRHQSGALGPKRCGVVFPADGPAMDVSPVKPRQPAAKANADKAFGSGEAPLGARRGWRGRFARRWRLTCHAKRSDGVKEDFVRNDLHMHMQREGRECQPARPPAERACCRRREPGRLARPAGFALDPA